MFVCVSNNVLFKKNVCPRGSEVTERLPTVKAELKHTCLNDVWRFKAGAVGGSWEELHGAGARVRHGFGLGAYRATPRA